MKDHTNIENLEIQEVKLDPSHPVFKVKYRLNSICTIDSASSIGSAKLPVVKILGTGGTIAAKGATAVPEPGYKVDTTIEELFATVPDLSQTCELEFEQLFNIDSKDITDEEINILRNKVAEELPNFDGIVITHGTDTLEETAFFLESTLNLGDKPVVMCGSMRPLTSASADGPLNLFQACVVAADKNSRHRGILVTLNDKIGSGYYISKTDANSLDTFKSLGHGYLGNFVSGMPNFYFPPLKPAGRMFFPLPTPFSGSLPNILVFYGHQCLNSELIKVAVEALSPPGIVIATMGSGLLPDSTNDLLIKISGERSIPVIYSKRATDGMIPPTGVPKGKTNYMIASGYLNPQKSRILLQLCLLQNFSISKTREVFRGVYGG